MDEQIQQLLDVKDRIIEQQQENIALLEDLVEARRVALVNQAQELAHHRSFEHSRKHPWRFFWWLVLNNVWPFSVWYHRFD